MRGRLVGGGLSIISLDRHAEFVEALRTAEKMISYLIGGHQVGARRLNHAGRGTTRAPTIRKDGRKMLLCEEDQLFRIGQITPRRRSIHLGWRRVIVVCGVALHCLLS